MTDITTTGGPSLFDWSLSGCVAVAFPKSKASGYAGAVQIARQAAHYVEGDIGGTLMHFAGFGREREQVARALGCIQQLAGIKGLQVYAGGAMLQERYRAETVLQCYLQASGCRDPRAHCCVSVDAGTMWQLGPAMRAVGIGRFSGVGPSPVGRVIVPCRLLVTRGVRYQTDHPSSEADQLQAAAVREGCDWCPNFPTTPGRST